MPNYRITLDILDVADGDIKDIADSIWEEWSDKLDAKRGDFKMEVLKEERSGGQPPRFFFHDYEPPS